MRRMIRKLTLLAAALMILALPAFADEGAMEKVLDPGQQSGKDECLLIAKDCGNRMDTLQQRIDRIKGEIGRGADVYTKDELQKLERQLEEAVRAQEELGIGG